VEPIEIEPHAHWIEALDPGLRLLDTLFPTEGGTTCSARPIRGRAQDRPISLEFKVLEQSLKLALVPTTEELQSCRWFGARIAESL
jgi:flavorubredoxin